jgi:AraC-like DNA-binding protein
MNATGPLQLYDLIGAVNGPGRTVVERAVADARGVVAWLVTLAGTVAWEQGGRRFWHRPGSVMVFDPRVIAVRSLPKRHADWRAVALVFAGGAARQHARHLERRYGSMQQMELRSAPVAGAVALAAAFTASDAWWGREQHASDWVATLHRHLLDHHASLSSLFFLPPSDPALAVFAGRTIKDLALEMGFSRTYLTRKLGAAWGRTPSEVLRGLRMQKAEALLRETSLPLPAVAATAGFDSVSGLFSGFRRAHALTPGDYRAKHRRKPSPPPPPVVRPPARPVPELPPAPRSGMRDAVHAPDWDGPYFRLLTCGEAAQANPAPFEIALSAVVKRCAIVITLEGEAVFETRGRSVRVGPGDAVAYPVPMNARWRPAAGGTGWTRVWLQFHGPLAEAFFDETVARFGNVQHLPRDSEPVRRARALARWVRSDRSEPAIFWSQHTYRWLLLWRSYLEQHAAPARERIHLKDAHSRLLAYPPTSLQHYADQLGYSVSYVSQKLKHQWNFTPGQILRSARLDRAAQLLRTGSQPVHEIARECGYATTSAFILAFKRRENLTPLAYRHHHRS